VIKPRGELAIYAEAAGFFFRNFRDAVKRIKLRPSKYGPNSGSPNDVTMTIPIAMINITITIGTIIYREREGK
jgi:hypothetical protein